MDRHSLLRTRLSLPLMTLALCTLIPFLVGCSSNSGSVARLGSPYVLDEFNVVLPTSGGRLTREVVVEVGDGVGATGAYLEVTSEGTNGVRFQLDISADNDQLEPISMEFLVPAAESTWIALNHDTHPEFFMGAEGWGPHVEWTGRLRIRMTELTAEPLSISGMVTAATYDERNPYGP